jgi:hypothetical protein
MQKANHFVEGHFELKSMKFLINFATSPWNCESEFKRRKTSLEATTNFVQNPFFIVYAESLFSTKVPQFLTGSVSKVSLNGGPIKPKT